MPHLPICKMGQSLPSPITEIASNVSHLSDLLSSVLLSTIKTDINKQINQDINPN